MIVGAQVVNFHRPELYLAGIKLRATATNPPDCNVCLRWNGSVDELQDLLTPTGIDAIQGTVRSDGDRRRTGRA